jgi:hypothetical protein
VELPADVSLTVMPFYNSDLEHIYVPAGLVDSYKADPLWAPWADKITPMPEEA